MKEILGPLRDKVEAKLGPVAPFVPMVAASLKKSIDEEDADAVRARAHELREAAAKMVELADKADAIVVDNSVSIQEAAEFALELEDMIDELEDVVRGFDEDDVPPPATGGGAGIDERPDAPA